MKTTRIFRNIPLTFFEGSLCDGGPFDPATPWIRHDALAGYLDLAPLLVRRFIEALARQGGLHALLAECPYEGTLRLHPNIATLRQRDNLYLTQRDALCLTDELLHTQEVA